MLDEEVEQAGFVGADFGEGGGYVGRYEVGAAFLGGKGELLLEPGEMLGQRWRGEVDVEHWEGGKWDSWR